MTLTVGSARRMIDTICRRTILRVFVADKLGICASKLSMFRITVSALFYDYGITTAVE